MREKTAPMVVHARDMQSSPEARKGQGEARSEQRRGGWPVEAVLVGELEYKMGVGVQRGGKRD